MVCSGAACAPAVGMGGMCFVPAPPPNHINSLPRSRRPYEDARKEIIAASKAEKTLARMLEEKPLVFVPLSTFMPT